MAAADRWAQRAAVRALFDSDTFSICRAVRLANPKSVTISDKDVVMSCINFQACPVDEFAKWGGLAYKRSGNAIVAPAHAKAAL